MDIKIHGASQTWDREKEVILSTHTCGLSPSQSVIAERIYSLLARESDSRSETDIMSEVTGKKTYKVYIIRKLVECGLIRRTGDGKRNSPYRYSIDFNREDSLYQKTEIRPETPSEPTTKAKVETTDINDQPVLESRFVVKTQSFPDSELRDFATFYQLLYNKHSKLPVSK